MIFLVTGGAGFIGSHFCALSLSLGHSVIVLDKLTYAGFRKNVRPDLLFIEGDICNLTLVRDILTSQQPDAIFNFAAESHVCRSIEDAEAFVRTNVAGTYSLLKASYEYAKPGFRFIQISTDEVFGDLGPEDPPFTEESPFRPNSPYAASKAAADHLVSAWHHTYGLDTVTTHCSNNYGPRQFPEKLIPLAIKYFTQGKSFPVHGAGENIRDWLWVGDHCRGILLAWADGKSGERYCFGGNTERTNLEILRLVGTQLARPYATYHTADRAGNDRRYAINYGKASRDLGWHPRVTLEEGLSETCYWYLANPNWYPSL